MKFRLNPAGFDCLPISCIIQEALFNNMKNRFTLFAAIISVSALFTGCFDFTGENGKLDGKVDLQNANVQPVMINQDLPVKKVVITSGKDKNEFEVEVASTDAQRKIGLMHRKSLDERKGMLFIFQNQGYMNFWMKDTLIPLDMLFINQNGMIEHVAKNVQPCTSKDSRNCPTTNSVKPVKFVVEINAGMAEKLGIRAGDQVTWI